MQTAILDSSQTNMEKLAMRVVCYMILNKLYEWHWLHMWSNWRPMNAGGKRILTRHCLNPYCCKVQRRQF